jgi:hypothetical protein
MSTLNVVMIGLLVPPFIIFIFVSSYDAWYYGLLCAISCLIVELIICLMIYYKIFSGLDKSIDTDPERCAITKQ